jgi:UDP-N-acetylglucosamine transferase subunit ALG13
MVLIFVTVGTQKFQFNRLLIAVDELIKQGLVTENVVAQIGYSTYMPMNCKYQKFMGQEVFQATMEKASVVITHGGTGTIFAALKDNKKIVAVPRCAQYGEHVDNHQEQLLKQFGEMGILEVCSNIVNLNKHLLKAKSRVFRQPEMFSGKLLDDLGRYLLLLEHENEL